jgi:hypothetical protein
MRRSGRIAVAAAATGVLAAGAITGFVLTSGNATAGTAASCQVTTSSTSCTTTQGITSPATIQLDATSTDDSGDVSVTLSWSATCALGSTFQTTTGPDETFNITTSDPTATYAVSIGSSVTDPDDCSVTGNMSSTTLTGSNTATVDIDFTPQTGASASASPSASASASASASPTASPSPSPTSSVPSGGISGLIKGYDGKCFDDKGNSSQLRAVVQIYSCNKSDKAQVWRYAAGELIHNGKCLNDKGNAGSGGKLILYTCQGSADELFVHIVANNTYQLKAHNWTLCIDDPAYSKKNGTQLTVYTCHQTGNQKWGLP